MAACSLLGTNFDDGDGDEDEGEVERTGKPRQAFLVCLLLWLSYGIPSRLNGNRSVGQSL